MKWGEQELDNAVKGALCPLAGEIVRLLDTTGRPLQSFFCLIVPPASAKSHKKSNSILKALGHSLEVADFCLGVQSIGVKHLQIIGGTCLVICLDQRSASSAVLSDCDCACKVPASFSSALRVSATWAKAFRTVWR